MSVFTWPTEVAPCRFESLLLSGARIKETCAKWGIGKPSACSKVTKIFPHKLLREKSYTKLPRDSFLLFPFSLLYFPPPLFWGWGVGGTRKAVPCILMLALEYSANVPPLWSINISSVLEYQIINSKIHATYVKGGSIHVQKTKWYKLCYMES